VRLFGIEEILESNGLDAEDASLIVRREIAAGGKGRVFINNRPATVSVLKQIALIWLSSTHRTSRS